MKAACPVQYQLQQKTCALENLVKVQPMTMALAAVAAVAAACPSQSNSLCMAAVVLQISTVCSQSHHESTKTCQCCQPDRLLLFCAPATCVYTCTLRVHSVERNLREYVDLLQGDTLC